jgi:ribonuclease E
MNAQAEGQAQQPMFVPEEGQASASQDGDANEQPRNENGNGNGNNGEPREKRSRDRYGRDRGPRGDRPPRHEFTEQGVTEIAAGETVPMAAQAPVVVQLAPQQAYTPAAASEAFAVVPVAPAPVAIAPVPAAAPVAPVVAPVAAPKATAAPAAAAAGSMPKVTGYALPQEDLVQVAQGSGLQWVNTNAESVAKVQAAIAAEAQTVHVPRARPAPVSMDTGPLVLVETKRDLRNMTLPFEENSQS